jgi:MFS family permease
MNESEKDFRDRLLDAERFSPALKEKYEKEVQEMLEQKLTGVRRWAYICGAAMGVGFALLFGTVAILAPREFPILGRIAFVTGAVFGLAFAGLAGWIAKKGTLKLKTHPVAMAGMAWGFTVIMVVLFMFLGSGLPDPIIGVRMIVIGLVFLVGAAVGLILARVEQAQLKTQEKLLEIEYRLAQMAEQIAKKK